MIRTDRILLDCDDVLLDFLPGFRAHAFRRGIQTDPAGPGSFDMAPWLGLSKAETLELIREFNHGSDTGFDHLEPIPGAIEGVGRLKAAGFRLHVVSSFSDCPDAYRRRFDNLERRFGVGVFEDMRALPLGGCKQSALRQHPPAIYIDDLLRNLLTARAEGHMPILLRAHHNALHWRADEKKALRAEAISLAETWSDILNHPCITHNCEFISVDRMSSELDVPHPIL